MLASSVQNRKAERPVNAILNYLYALVEAEAILACQAVGLDPGSVWSIPTRGPAQSLALDIMEPVRPEADELVLDLVEHRTFRKVDFVETQDGHVRLRAPLSHDLAETMPRWAKSLAPIAEHVAHAFGRAMAGKYRPVSPLTRNRTRAAQAVVKARKSRRARPPRAPHHGRTRPSVTRSRCGPARTAEAQSRTLATSAARRASTPTPHRHRRSGAGVAPPSQLASERCRSGTRPTQVWSTTPSCSGGRSSRGWRP